MKYRGMVKRIGSNRSRIWMILLIFLMVAILFGIKRTGLRETFGVLGPSTIVPLDNPACRYSSATTGSRASHKVDLNTNKKYLITTACPNTTMLVNGNAVYCSSGYGSSTQCEIPEKPDYIVPCDETAMQKFKRWYNTESPHKDRYRAFPRRVIPVGMNRCLIEYDYAPLSNTKDLQPWKTEILFYKDKDGVERVKDMWY